MSNSTSGKSSLTSAYHLAMRDVILHRDAGSENTAEGVLARLKAMLVEPPDIATALEQNQLEGHLPEPLGNAADGRPLYAADAVAHYLRMPVDTLLTALASVPRSRWPIQLTTTAERGLLQVPM